MLTWTTEKPTQPGWYWFREYADQLIDTLSSETTGNAKTLARVDHDPQIIKIEIGLLEELQVTFNGDEGDYFSNGDRFNSWSLSELDGQWAGPLAPPEG